MAATRAVESNLDATRRIGSFEGLRAIAALSVLVFHMTRVVEMTHPGLVPAAAVYWLERLGPFGVGIFFVLSGFLLSRPFVEAAFRGTSTPDLGRYYLRRITRIYPAYWLAAAVYLVLTESEVLRSAGDYGVSLGLVQNYRTGSLFEGMSLAWTLVIEVSFYLVLPGVAWMLRGRRTGSATVVLRRHLFGLGVLYGLGLLVRVWSMWIRSPELLRAGAWQPHINLEIWLPGFLDWFALGILFAVVVEWWKMVGGPRGPMRWLADHPFACWLIAGALYWLSQQMNAPIIYRVEPAQFMLHNTVMPLAAAFLVAPMVLAPHGPGLIRRVLASRAAVAVGAVSYGIYLWHISAIYQTQVWISDGAIPRSALLQTILVITMTAIAATLSYFIIEAPLMRWSARVGRRGRGRTGDASSPKLGAVPVYRGPGRSGV